MVVKISPIQRRLAEKSRKDYALKKELKRPIWDELNEVFNRCDSAAKLILSSTLTAVNHMVSADEQSPILDDLERYELLGGMRLLDCDVSHYLKCLVGIHDRHKDLKGHLPLGMTDEENSMRQLALEVHGAYHDLQQVSDALVAADNNLIFEVLQKTEKRFQLQHGA